MFYHYSQNNSGGSFDNDDRVCHHVIVEADSADEADVRAESIGLYFDGVERGLDCSCCGDRWYRAYEKSTAEPMIYNKSPEMHRDPFTPEGEVYCRVYYLDNSVKEFYTPAKKAIRALRVR